MKVTLLAAMLGPPAFLAMLAYLQSLLTPTATAQPNPKGTR
jgi:hypothetical protein